MTDKDIILRDEHFVTDVYNQFSPDYPLPDEDSRYVSCREGEMIILFVLLVEKLFALMYPLISFIQATEGKK